MSNYVSGNTLIHQLGSPAKVIATALAVIIRNNLQFAQRADRSYAKEFVKKGDTITYKKAIKHRVIDGPDVTGNWQTTEQPTDTIQINKWKTIPIKFGAKEKTLTVKDFVQEYLLSDGISIANQIDMDGLELYKKIY